MPKFKVGDKIMYVIGFDEQCAGTIGYVADVYKDEIMIEVVSGWFRNYEVPKEYKSKLSDEYWYVNKEDFDKIKKVENAI